MSLIIVLTLLIFFVYLVLLGYSATRITSTYYVLRHIFVNFFYGDSTNLRLLYEGEKKIII